ncbi:MAG TPA: FHA domain-containing protein [Streptosporangiaceae bacterium]|nr:FHA domain-containing protein [Streptosporangiaceae bacterium]
MNELSLTIIRVAFLAVLWLFVIAAIGVVRTDLLGGPSATTRRGKARQAQAPRPGRPARAPRPGRGSPRILVVTAGALKGTSIDLAQQQITLGRANDATLVLNDDYASSRHARIFPQDGQWIVEDLGSTNGTYLDRQKVTRPLPVPLGVPIRIGKTVLELRR